MTIKTRCGSCGTRFQAKDSLAGKRVKCPKCKNPIQIPTPRSAPLAQPSQPQSGKRGGTRRKSPAPYNPLLDLLDEVEVKSATRGPVCPQCGASMTPGAVICIECGFNLETEEQLSTTVDTDGEQETATVGITDTDRILQRAEREVEDMPISADDQDFGDGASSFMIAGVAGLILLGLVGIGLAVILMMDVFTTVIASWAISFLASTGLALAMALWITIVAFRQKPGQGIACIATGGLWCVVYGFMQGKQLLVPTVILLLSLIVGLASGAYTWSKGWKPPREDVSLPRIEWSLASQLGRRHSVVPLTLSECEMCEPTVSHRYGSSSI